MPPVLYCPGEHAAWVGDVDPTGQEYPAVHAPLHVDDVRPADDPYDPATHEEHAEDPSVLNWPAGHCPEHAEDVRPTVAPNVPGGHAVHTAAPAVEYRPATHCTAVGDVLPAAHAYPAVHWPEQLARPGVEP